MLHEALDRRFAGAVGVAHPLRHLALQVEGQAVARLAAGELQVAAHRPEEVGRAPELAQLGGGQQPALHQAGERLDLMDVLADPEQRVEVAQGPLAVLHIGFDDIAAVAHLPVPLVAFGEFRGDEGAVGAGHHLLPEAPPHLRMERAVAVEEARLQQGRADGEVVAGQSHALIHRAHGVADRQPQVPQAIEDRLDHLLRPAGGLAGQQEGEVHIRLRRHLGPAIAADRRQREPLARRAVGGGLEPGDGGGVEQAHDSVGEVGGAGRRLMPGGGRVGEPGRDGGAPVGEHVAREPHDGGAQTGAVRQRRQLLGERAPIHDAAPGGEFVIELGHGGGEGRGVGRWGEG